MSRIDTCFQSLKKAGKTGLVTYLTAADPDIQTSEALIKAMAQSGADIIEIGMPFSDPMADGPAIQAAALRALAAGGSMRVTLDVATKARQANPDTPIILMGYSNPIFQYGVEQFCNDAKVAGVDGLIIVDLPPEESVLIAAAAAEHGLHIIYLVTPTTDTQRLQVIVSQASGFLYYVSIAGITGTASAAAADIDARVAWIKSHTDLPLVVGFGVKTPADAAAMAQSGCDAVVVGSALVAAIEQSNDPLQTCADFTKRLKEAL